MTDIKFIRLKNGDDIIATVESVNNGAIYDLSDPWKIIYIYDEEHMYQSFILSMIPWVYGTVVKQQTFSISATDVLTMALPSSRVEQMYMKILEKKMNIPETKYHDDEATKEQLKSVEDFVLKSLKNIGKTGKS